MENFHYHFYEDQKAHELLKQLIKLTNKIMSKQEDLTAQIAQVTADAKAERLESKERNKQVKAAMDTLAEEIQLLKDRLAETGVSDADMQAHIDNVAAIGVEVKGIVRPEGEEEEEEV